MEWTIFAETVALSLTLPFTLPYVPTLPFTFMVAVTVGIMLLQMYSLTFDHATALFITELMLYTMVRVRFGV